MKAGSWPLSSVRKQWGTCRGGGAGCPEAEGGDRAGGRGGGSVGRLSAGRHGGLLGPAEPG